MATSIRTRWLGSRWLFAAEIFLVASVTSLSCSFAAAAPDAASNAATNAAADAFARARLVDASGTAATLELGAAPKIFPQLTVVHALPEPAVATPAVLLLPYTDALVDDWNIEDEHELGVFTQDASGTWSWAPANVDADTNTVYVGVEAGAAWAAGPPWMMRAWQQRQIVGADFVGGERNVLVIHGWNSDPWEGCMLGLMSGLVAQYDHISAFAYPSALDIAANGNWLRDEIESRWPDAAFDIVGFSEGGLVARAAIEPHAWNNHATIDAHIGRLVTIAAPHAGVLPDATLSLLNDDGARQMRPGSDFLRELNADVDRGGIRYEFIAGDTGASHDGIVPVESALAIGVIQPEMATTLPLPHSTAAGKRGLPCDPLVDEAIAAWR